MCVHAQYYMCAQIYVHNPHTTKVMCGKEGGQDKSTDYVLVLVLPPEKLITFPESVSLYVRI